MEMFYKQYKKNTSCNLMLDGGRELEKYRNKYFRYGAAIGYGVQDPKIMMNEAYTY